MGRFRILGRFPFIAGIALVLSMSAMPGHAAASPTAGPLGGGPEGTLIQRTLESQVLDLTNRQRRAHGCPALRASSALRSSSRTHTVTMARAKRMSHQLPGELRFSTRITRAGYTQWRIVAENVARGFSSPRAVVRAWMNSPSHRRNILNCQLRDLGVGVVREDGELWWTQNFGRR